jgi:hypothetical protein
MRVGLLADAHGLECTPHNWGNVPDMALHFHVELALPNSYWFEMPFPAEYADRPYYKDKFRIDADGYVSAPRSPALAIHSTDALDKVPSGSISSSDVGESETIEESSMIFCRLVLCAFLLLQAR